MNLIGYITLWHTWVECIVGQEGVSLMEDLLQYVKYRRYQVIDSSVSYLLFGMLDLLPNVAPSNYLNL